MAGAAVVAEPVPAGGTFPVPARLVAADKSGAAEAGSPGAPDVCALRVAPPTSAESFDAVLRAGAVADGALTGGVAAGGVLTEGTVATGVDTRGVVTDGALTAGVVTEGVVPTGVFTEGTVAEGTLGCGRMAAAPASGWATSTPRAAATIPTDTPCLVPMTAETAAVHETCVFLQIPPEKTGRRVPALAAPHLVGDPDDQLELGPLVVDRELVALLG